MKTTCYLNGTLVALLVFYQSALAIGWSQDISGALLFIPLAMSGWLILSIASGYYKLSKEMLK